MRKILLSFALVALFTIAIPTVANADTPCAAIVLICPDGTQHIVVVCDLQGDSFAWDELLCGLGGQ